MLHPRQGTVNGLPLEGENAAAPDRHCAVPRSRIVASGIDWQTARIRPNHTSKCPSHASDLVAWPPPDKHLSLMKVMDTCATPFQV